MNKEEIEELMEYNLEYLEARNSEEIFGGDYTSEVDLKYANKKIDKLQQENKQLKDNWNKLKKELKDKFEEYKYVEDECLRTMAQEDDSILFSMSCIEKGDK